MNTVMKRRIRRNVPLYLMFIPGLVFYIVIKFIPMAGVMLAFKEYYLILGLWDSPWVGWDNFNTLFTFPQTVQVIRNTLVLSMLTVFVGFPFPVILALLLNEVRVRWFKKGVQTLVFMPHFFSWVIVGGLVVTLFAQEGGTINQTAGTSPRSYGIVFIRRGALDRDLLRIGHLERFRLCCNRIHCGHINDQS